MRKRVRILLSTLLACLCIVQASIGMASSTPRPAPVIPPAIKPSPTAALAPKVESAPAEGAYILERFEGTLTIQYTASVGAGMNDYLFILEGQEEYAQDEYAWSVFHAQRLTVLDTETYDTVFAEELESDCEDAYMGFHVVDLNFDGYLDIMVACLMGGAHQNYWYYAYLWDPKAETFAANESFTDICNATVDPDRKAILSIGANSAYEMCYDIYRFKNGVFELEAELITEVGWDTTSGGLDIWRSWEYRIKDGEAELVSSLEFVERDVPDAFMQYFQEGSYWDLDNPIWFSGDHYTERIPDIDPSYIGYWHAMPSVAGGLAERYWFQSDGTFIYGCSEMDGRERLRYIAGNWASQNGVLTLTVNERVYWEGGVLAYPRPASDEKELVDYKVMYEELEEPEVIVLEVGGAEWDYESERYVITVGEQVFYDFSNQEDLMDGYFQLKSDAAKKIAYVDEKIPLTDRGDEDVLLIPDDYGNPFPYVRGIVEESIFYHDGRDEWISYYYIQLSPKQYYFYYDMIDGITPEPSLDAYCEVQVTGYDKYDLSEYLGQEIVFIGSAFEGNTVYHRRHIVIQIMEIVDLGD